jgi:TolB-like protein/Flp pilus assembly protein TadD
LDKRTDIWSFGCILYEVLTGQRAFTGETVSSTIAAIHSQDPDWSRLPEATPPSLRELLKRCLDKDPDRRLHDIADARIEIDDSIDRLETGRTRRDRGGPEERPSQGPPAAHGRSVKIVSGAVGILAIAALLYIVVEVTRPDPQSREPGPPPGSASIAVLPFRDLTPARDSEFLGDGITETLINRLTKVGGLAVAARTSAFAFKGKQTDIREIGQALGVASILEGSVMTSGDRVRIAAQLINAADGFTLWSDTYEQRLEDLFEVQDEIARSITQALKVELVGGGAPSPDAVPTTDLEAYTLYLRGRHLWNRRTADGIKAAIDYFDQAIARDPGFTWAHVGRADAYCIAGFYDYLPPTAAFPEAKIAAQRALSLDAALSEAHNSLGYIALYYEWNWPEAERRFLRAIDLNPRYPVAHQWYANLLTARGRFDEAELEMRRGLELDPLSLINSAALGWVHYHAGDTARALAAFERTLELEPTFYLAHLFGGWTYEAAGRHDEAIEAIGRAVELSNRSPNTVTSLARTKAVAGRPEEAVALLEELAAAGGYVSDYDLARVHLALGDEDRAFALLDRAFENRAHSLVFLDVDPQLEGHRSHPAFRRLAARIGLD